MALITPLELIIYLDLPTDTQPVDRATLVCELVIEAVDRVAGTTLSAPYAAGVKGVALAAASRLYTNPTGLWTEAIDDYTAAYPGTRAGAGILTEAEKKDLLAALGLGGPLYSFPEPDWHWSTVTPTISTA